MECAWKYLLLQIDIGKLWIKRTKDKNGKYEFIILEFEEVFGFNTIGMVNYATLSYNFKKYKKDCGQSHLKLQYWLMVHDYTNVINQKAGTIIES